jgi:hypothetical protein
MTMQPYGAQYSHPQAYTDQRTGNTVEVVFGWVLAVLTLGYMLPWAIAATRGKSNSLAVALVNFFTGWTLIGWIAALVMACQAHQLRQTPMNVIVQANATAIAPPPGWFPDPHDTGGTVQRYWDGQTWTSHVHQPSAQPVALPTRPATAHDPRVPPDV